MSRSSSRTTFRQIDVTRALRAAKAAGLKVAQARIDAAGEIVLTFGEAKQPEDPAAAAFDRWMGNRSKPAS